MNFFKNLRWSRRTWDESIKRIKGGVIVASSLGVLPYIWNEEEARVEFSSARYPFFVAQCLLHFINHLWIVFRWIQLSYFDEGSRHLIPGLQYNFIAYSLVVTMKAGSLYHARHFHNYINRLIHYIQRDFKQLPMGDRMPNFKRMPIMLALASIMLILLNVSTVFRKSSSPHLLTSVIPEVGNVKKWKLTPFALIHGYIWCAHFSSIYFYVVLIFFQVSTIQNALSRTNIGHLSSPMRWLKETRKLEILQGNANTIERWILWGMQVTLMSFVVYGVCTAIWSEGTQAYRSMISSFLSINMLRILWTGLGRVCETSTEVMAERKHQVGTSILFRKHYKSMRPIRVQIGGYFYADAALVLTLLSIVAENILSLVMTF